MVTAALIEWREFGHDRSTPNPAPDTPRLKVATAVDNVCGYEVLEEAGGPAGYADGAVVRLTGQNDSTAEVVVTGIRVEVKSSTATTVRAQHDDRPGCPSDPLPTRDFQVDLEDLTPQLQPVPKRIAPG